MNGTLGEFVWIVIICIAAYGGLLLFGTSVKIHTHPRRRSSDLFREREAKKLEDHLTEEAQKREQKRNKLTLIAKQRPDRIASAIHKWILENGGKPVH